MFNVGFAQILNSLSFIQSILSNHEIFYRLKGPLRTWKAALVESEKGLLE